MIDFAFSGEPESLAIWIVVALIFVLRPYDKEPPGPFDGEIKEFLLKPLDAGGPRSFAVALIAVLGVMAIFMLSP